jgi:hypothetical protein
VWSGFAAENPAKSRIWSDSVMQPPRKGGKAVSSLVWTSVAAYFRLRDLIAAGDDTYLSSLLYALPG